MMLSRLQAQRFFSHYLVAAYDWLKTSAFFMQQECKIVKQVQNCHTEPYYK